MARLCGFAKGKWRSEISCRRIEIPWCGLLDPFFNTLKN
jgi:hypothetical protein